MEFKKGTWRFVILLPKLGIAIKLPRVYLKSVLGSIRLYFSRGVMMRMFKKEIFSYTVYMFSSIKGRLFRGIIDNWHEYVFYQKIRNPFLLPTYFSFFGLINVQELGGVLNVDNTDIWCQLYEITDGLVFKSSHHFDSPANFSFKKGKIQILDYGDPKVQEVVEKCGALIQGKFDPNYSWEKRKAERQ